MGEEKVCVNGHVLDKGHDTCSRCGSVPVPETNGEDVSTSVEPQPEPKEPEAEVVEAVAAAIVEDEAEAEVELENFELGEAQPNGRVAPEPPGEKVEGELQEPVFEG